MVIDQLNVVCVAVLPVKAQPPLSSHANAPFAGPIASKLLQPIAGEGTKILKAHNSIEHPKLSKSGTLQIQTPATDRFAMINPLGVLVAKASDHLR